MRSVVVLLVTGLLTSAGARAQTMTEAAAAAAGGTVGGAAGKKVSEGVTAIFEKVDKAGRAAAADDKGKKGSAGAPASNPKGALIEAGPGRPATAAASVKSIPAESPASKPVRKPKPAADVATSVVPTQHWEDVPPPPPLENHNLIAAKPAPPPVVVAPPPPPPPPPPVVIPAVTLEDLQTITAGMSRSEVLKVGQPASRITMFEEGGLLEIFSYHSHDAELGDRTLGTIRLNNGTVSSVQWRK